MTRLGRGARLVLDSSLLLVIGTVAALVWANLDTAGYDQAAGPLHFWVNDVGMVFFFGLAAKEVFEATLPGGAFGSPRQALSPLIGAVGGMLVPAVLYLAIARFLGADELSRGWAIPSATDIAFSAMVARLVFPARHPAITFLLMLAIADDALGLVILALFYPSGPLSPVLFASGMTAALGLAFALNRWGAQGFWAYVLGPGVLSWAALYWGGIHPALALVPVIPFMPHARTDLGLFAAGESTRTDTLNRFEHWWATPVQIILLLFGFANAGVPFQAIGAGTACVVIGLLAGKPIGIMAATTIAGRLGTGLPTGLRTADLLLIGIIAGIGFTVALFFATASFPPGPLLSETKMGALLSFAAAPIAIALGRALRPRR